MFKRLKVIEEKLDMVIKNQGTQINMISSLIELVDQKQRAGIDQKQYMKTYMENVTNLMEANGAPKGMIDQFKNILSGE